MQESPFPHTQYSYEPPGKKSRKGRIFALLLILLLLAGGGYALKTYVLDEQTVEEPTPTPTPTQIIFPTDTPTPEVSPSGKLTPTKTTAPTTKPTVSANAVDKATGLDRSTLSVMVQNGGGVVGAGSKAADILRQLGYNVTGTGNASSFDYETTVIQVKASQSKYLDLLKKDLATTYTISSSSSATLAASSDTDAVVIVGKK